MVDNHCLDEPALRLEFETKLVMQSIEYRWQIVQV